MNFYEAVVKFKQLKTKEIFTMKRVMRSDFNYLRNSMKIFLSR